MPSLNFVLPHWLYWSGLVVFPIVIMILIRRREKMTSRRVPAVSLPVGYLMLVCGGFVGLHRFYLKSLLGFVYIPLFLLILFGNVEARQAREGLSSAANDAKSLQVLADRYTRRVERGRQSAQRQLDAVRQEISGAEVKLAEARKVFDFWNRFSSGFAALIGLLLLFDAFRLPPLTRKIAEQEGDAPPPAFIPAEELGSAGHHPVADVKTPATRLIDGLSGYTGEFVALWSIIAVFVYYYEVVARYVFNSPTNWAHESMFLMFGMQYLIAGAYALREDSHVRVDVVYLMLSDKAKVITDLITSIFFFIFTVTLLITGWIFFVDSLEVFEVSFTEWAIQYYPVKSTIFIGGVLIVLQGISKVIKDFILLYRRFA